MDGGVTPPTWCLIVANSTQFTHPVSWGKFVAPMLVDEASFFILRRRDFGAM